jgi:hypothetical protein
MAQFCMCYQSAMPRWFIRLRAYNRTQLEDAVSSTSDNQASISVRLQNVTNELRQIQDLLTLEEDVDPRVLTDFRDAVNRVRTTAWAVEQYANSKTTETDSQTVSSVLAGERVRVAYQLCRLIQSDLATPGIQFQKGQLLQFREATNELEGQLRTAAGE